MSLLCVVVFGVVFDVFFFLRPLFRLGLSVLCWLFVLFVSVVVC